MSEAQTAPAFGNQAGAASAAPAFFIRTDEKTRDLIDFILRTWVEKCPHEVMAWHREMAPWREAIRTMHFSYAVAGKDEHGETTFSIPLAIPTKIDSAMNRAFGKDWIHDRAVFRIFKQEFTLGNPLKK